LQRKNGIRKRLDQKKLLKSDKKKRDLKDSEKDYRETTRRSRNVLGEKRCVHFV